MTGARWTHVEELFVRALEQAETARVGYVHAQAADDPELAAEVLSLLENAGEAGLSIEEAIGAEMSQLSQAWTARSGERIGPYRLGEQLGEGGMGVVYAAARDDAEFKQAAAIKILRRGLGSPEAIARFRDERQILASLEHPNIVRLLDGGTTEDHLPYIVMERVHGVSITRHATERTLSIADRLRLFAEVCTAVQCAHERGVIHRDLKPSNILVDGTGTPKLLDFGVAKLVAADAEREAHTRTGAVMFTPEYASPEQARGEPTTAASDVYSLGAVLYELLTGRPPHTGTTLEIIPKIADEDPPRPSTVTMDERRQLAGDLDAIVAMALRKEPARRYSSAEALGEDLHRHLAGLPVHAHAPSIAYRARKLVRRHRAKLVVASALVVAAGFTTRSLIAGGDRPPSPPGWRAAIQPIPWPVEDDSAGYAISPDGSQLAFTSALAGSDDNRLLLMPTRGGPAQLIEHNVVGAPRWTRDGRGLIYPGHGHLRRKNLTDGTVEDLGDTEDGADDCGDAVLRLHEQADGHRVERRSADGSWHEVFRFRSPTYDLPFSLSCDPATGEFLVVRGPSMMMACVGDITIVDRAGRERALTHDHSTCSATFTPGGRSIVLSALHTGVINLHELVLASGEQHQLTTGAGADMWPDVSANGAVVAFSIDPHWQKLIVGDRHTTREIHVERGVIDGFVPTRDGASLIVQRGNLFAPGERFGTIRLADGVETELGEGVVAFPAFDGTHVYFRTLEHGGELRAVPIAGGGSTTVARFPAPIALGVDAADGVHVMIERGGQFEGWRVTSGGTPEPEGVPGLVIPAPRGGWRMVLVPQRDYRIRLVAPGAALTAPAFEVTSVSASNLWLDDHRLVIVDDQGQFAVVDVTTRETTRIDIDWLNPMRAASILNSRFKTILPDGEHFVQLGGSEDHPTRQLITNFATRPWRP